MEKSSRKKNFDQNLAPVHASTSKRKTFSANFPKNQETGGENFKFKKKQLLVENSELAEENRELTRKFVELDELSTRKITKLKEKFLENQKVFHMEKCRLEEKLKLNEMNSESLKGELRQLKCENKRLNDDLEMMKVVVFRLNVHLERYQETLRKHDIPINPENFNNNSEINKKLPLSWGSVNVHTLGPLLDAYENFLIEKDEIIKSYDEEFSKFTRNLKEIIEENEILYSKLNDDVMCSSKLKIELDKLKNNIESLKKENDGLIKKCAIKQDKLEDVLRIYETRVNQMKRDFDVLHVEYSKYRTENASLKERNSNLLLTIEETKINMQNYVPLGVYNTSINECKKWYEELKSNYEKEKEKLIKINEQLKNDLEKSENCNKNLEKNIKKFEVKYLELEHALSEVQLSRTALRKQLHKTMSFAKEMVTEQEVLLKALNQRHIENRFVKKIGTEMATKMDSLKEQLKDVQKNAWQEFSTVEKTMQEQQDLIESMKWQHRNEIDKLTKIIHDKEGKKEEMEDEEAERKSPMSPYKLFEKKFM